MANSITAALAESYCPDHSVCAWTGYFEGGQVEFGPNEQGRCTQVSFDNRDVRYTIQNNTRWSAYIYWAIDCTGDRQEVPSGYGMASTPGFRSVRV
ncbi:peptidase inhibitor family I36 protein [Nocardia brasiliensis]|uniref:peptidase inhibitor family I36 protein n=1 Tax=Nocardia brasiliensis TaxID=37326 RepID=UPI003D89BFB0